MLLLQSFALHLLFHPLLLILILPYDLLDFYTLSLSCLLLLLYLSVHFFLVDAHLGEFVLNVALFSLLIQLMGLHLELVIEHLILTPCLVPLLLPSTQTVLLPLHGLLVQLVKFFFVLTRTLFQLLFLQLLK